MTFYLLVISVIALSYLSLYALIFIGLALVFIFLGRRQKPTWSGKKGGEAITVLIPSRDEGEGLLDAVLAVVKQDYNGFVEVQILLNNSHDSSLDHLSKLYNFSKSILDPSQSNDLIIWHQNKRRVRLILSGKKSKRDKLSLALSSLSTPLVAFLDVDHRPTGNWLSSSVELLNDQTKFGKNNFKTAGVQTRRCPLNTGHLAQIIDSAQNHLGNELVNNVLLARGVFFTGTAAVFKTDILHQFPLSDSITEDTYLSYDLYCSGYRIAYNDRAASYEEVAPSFQSYVARRRRWSAGHNQVFFSHLIQILKSKLPLRDKATLLIHGQFYLVPLAVWLLLSTYGLYFFFQLADNMRLAATILALFLSLVVAYVFRQKERPWYNLFLDWLIGMLWLWPQLAIVSVYLYKLIGAESYYYILIFPYAKDWILWHSILLAAPLWTLLVAWYFFKDIRQFRVLWLFPAYILSLFLDIYAALLGLVDFLFGRAHWSRIERQNKYSKYLVPADLENSLLTGRAVNSSNKFIYILALIGVAVILLLNDFLAVNNCGEIKPFLWSPLFFKPEFSLNLNIDVDKKIVADHNLRVQATARLDTLAGERKKNNHQELIMRSYLDGKFLEEKHILPGLTSALDQNYPLGWEQHKLSISLTGVGIGRFARCQREIAFSTTAKELRGNDLYINDEKFLIKGLIPSFSNNQIDLDLETGLKQFKEIGVNTIRFYHGVNNNLLNLASNNSLLIIDQPDRSTWDELDLTSSRQVNAYLKRYDNLVNEHQGEPYILWDGLGNEWEIGSEMSLGQSITLVNQTIEKAAQTRNPLSSYSTYYTFINYPVAVRGINMLDTGQTYWGKALDLLKNSHEAFYASEFGGFVAFWENTEPELRLNRIADEWKTLISAGAIGANFYESHDNWAQPVAIGYNDPWQADQPDDLRGFWDENNKAKPELAVLTKLLSDFSVNSDSIISDPALPVTMVIKNIRFYTLQDVVLEIFSTDNSAAVFSKNLGDFVAGESRELSLDLPEDVIRGENLSLRFSYSSHSGLKGVSRLEIKLPLVGEEPLILNDDFISQSRSSKIISGRLLSSSQLLAVLPLAWERFSLNGKEYSNSSGVQKFNLDNPYHDVKNLQVSRNGKDWGPLNSFPLNASGSYYLRFNWPDLEADKQFLILEGTGSTAAEISWSGKTIVVPTQNYRENIVRAADLDNPAAGQEILIKLDRNQSAYIYQRSIRPGLKGVKISLDQDMLIDLSAPFIFAPLNIELKKIEQ